MKSNLVERSAASVRGIEGASLFEEATHVDLHDEDLMDPAGGQRATRQGTARNHKRPAVQSVEPTLALCFTRGGLARTQYRRLGAEGLLIGREQFPFGEAFRDPRMSVRHARIEVHGERVTVRDLGSTHGTWVNGESISQERVLSPGDVLRMGDTLFVYAHGTGDSDSQGDLVGSSAPMVAVRRSIDAVAPRKHAVVVTGETGTGKEVVARMIHERSGRTGPFIAVNCSTFTDALLASELFGHVKGAFTGAVTEHTGLFRAARGGTLLLDELADIPAQLQACLLRVLETHSVRPVGGTRDIEVDVRIVATSNQELVELVQAGKFRADLYARLAQWTIRMPKLSGRREDLPELVAHLLPRVDGAGRRLTPDLCEALLLHDWPLNVRGLLNVLSIAVVSAESDDAPLSLSPEVQEVLWRTRSMAPAPKLDAEPVAAPPAAAEPAWTPPRTLDKAELERLMAEFQGHVAAAARHVGMTRPKLYRMLGAHGLEPSGFRRARGG
jgi:DNA-binding NtrC family response regulator